MTRPFTLFLAATYLLLRTRPPTLGSDTLKAKLAPDDQRFVPKYEYDACHLRGHLSS